MESILVKNQVKEFGRVMISGWRARTTPLYAEVRYDDKCGNGHNTLSITGEICSNGAIIACGCLHDEIKAHVPFLRPFLKWHLFSTDGPMHYIANTIYHVQQGKLDYARSSAVWPDATDEELTAPDLKERLEARLPALLVEFREAVEKLGFVY